MVAQIRPYSRTHTHSRGQKATVIVNNKCPVISRHTHTLRLDLPRHQGLAREVMASGRDLTQPLFYGPFALTPSSAVYNTRAVVDVVVKVCKKQSGTCGALKIWPETDDDNLESNKNIT